MNHAKLNRQHRHTRYTRQKCRETFVVGSFPQFKVNQNLSPLRPTPSPTTSSRRNNNNKRIERKENKRKREKLTQTLHSRPLFPFPVSPTLFASAQCLLFRFLFLFLFFPLLSHFLSNNGTLKLYPPIKESKALVSK